MEDYFYLKPNKMLDLVTSLKLTGSEMKMLFAIMYCMAETRSTLFINNSENRKRMKKIEFDRSPERISLILSSLTKKGAIKREINGVYRLPENLFLLSGQVIEK